MLCVSLCKEHCTAHFHCPQLRGSFPLQVRVQQFTSARSEDFAFLLHVPVGFVNLFPLFFFSHSCFLSSTSFLLLH